MLTLRPYQDEIVAATRVALRTHGAVLIQLPTGGGKTALSAKMLGTVAAKNLTGHFVCHRQELIDQTIATFDECGIAAGVIAAGYAPNPLQPVQICGIDTLRYRLAGGTAIRRPRFVVWDEAHHIPAAGWSKVMSYYSDAKHVGLTATPERLDGKGLDDNFSHMVEGPSTAWLIEHGFLCRYRAFTPHVPDMGDVHVKMGDYVKGEAEDRMDRPVITGDAIKHYFLHARDKRAVVFCVSRKHSNHVAEQFRAAGVVAWHLDGETDRGERKHAVEAFRRGEIKVLCNVDLFGEGFDLPAMEACIMLRPTKSLALYLQQCGRALRTSPGKAHALLLDHAGNIARHGLPDDERQWSLLGRPRKGRKDDDDGEATVPLKMCPVCFMVHRPAPRCPACGHAYEVQGRLLEQVDGDLAEVDVEEQRRRRKQEQADAQSLAQLVKLGTARGYKDPERWAAHVWTARVERLKREGRIEGVVK